MHTFKKNMISVSVCGYGTEVNQKLQTCLLCNDTFDHASQFVLKVWNLTNCRLKINHNGHTGYLNTVTVSPDGSLCASGGKVCNTLGGSSLNYCKAQYSEISKISTRFFL